MSGQLQEATKYFNGETGHHCWEKTGHKNKDHINITFLSKSGPISLERKMEEISVLQFCLCQVLCNKEFGWSLFQGDRETGRQFPGHSL